jgi:DNA invertase Pin-like site-specific DNA recombinase
MGTPQNTAAIYIRKSSTDNRSGSNRSLSEQRHECLAAAEREGLTIVRAYEERVGISASRFSDQRRPQWDRAVNEMGTTYTTLITQAVDRTTRRGISETGDLLKALEASGGRLIALDDGIDSDLMGFADRMRFIMAGELAREESDRIGKRTRRGKDEARRRGAFQGGRMAFGLMKDPNAPYGVAVEPEAAAAFRSIVEDIIRGASLSMAATTLNEKGFLTSAGNLWTNGVLSRTLRRPFLIGHRYQAGDLLRHEDGTPIQVTEPIISEAMFRRVDKAIRSRVTRISNMKSGQNAVRSPAHLLTGLLRCYCGTTMKSEKAGQEGARRSYYRCRACLPTHAIRGLFVDETVARRALSFLSALEPDSPIMDEVGRRWLDRFSPEQHGRQTEIRDKLDIVEGKHRDLQDNYYARDTMDTSTYERHDRKLAGQVAALRDELRETPTPQADLTALLDLTASGDGEDLVGPGSAWAALPTYEQREILSVLVDRVVIERRDKPSTDVEGRTIVTMATDSNVIDLANRFGDEPRPAEVTTKTA